MATTTTKAQQEQRLRAMHQKWRNPPAERVKHFDKPLKNGGSVRLSYVGHADLTDILLDEDPFWNWEPAGKDPTTGSPVIDRDPKGYARGLWIKLTVHGVTRYGFGNCGQIGEAQKVLIGNALRNAAMRFGIGLSLWKANTDALLEHGLDPDDQAVVEGDEEAEGPDADSGTDATPAANGHQQPVDGTPAPTPTPAAQGDGPCPDCYAPARAVHATKCPRRKGAQAAPAAPEAPAADDEAPAADDPWRMDLDAVRVEVAKHLTAMRGEQVEKFVTYRRVNHLPDDLNTAPEEKMRGLLAWLRGQPVARVAGQTSG